MTTFKCGTLHSKPLSWAVSALSVFLLSTCCLSMKKTELADGSSVVTASTDIFTTETNENGTVDKAPTYSFGTITGQDAVFTVEDIFRCLLLNATMKIMVNTARLTYAQNTYGDDTETMHQTQALDGVHVCTMQLRAPAGLSWSVSFRLADEQCVHKNFTMSITDETRQKTSIISRCTISYHTVTHGDILTVRFETRSAVNKYSLDMNLTAVYMIETVYTTPKSGYIHRPWHVLPSIRPYTFEDHHVVLSAPADHIIVVSFMNYTRRFPGCEDTFFEISETENSSNTLIRDCDIHDGNRVFFLNTTNLYLTIFVNWAVWAYRFQLVFSYHEASMRPRQLPDGLWNCSFPDWSDFKQHFLCDLIEQCAGNEDETECEYHGHCGPHKLTIGGRCYQYVRKADKLSWVEANFDCLKRGGYLASFNTPREWHLVTGVMKRHWIEYYVGLRSSPSSLHKMYKTVPQWTDSTMAYYLRRKFIEFMGYSCGTIDNEQGQRIIQTLFCSTRSSRHFLCEYDPEQESTTPIGEKKTIVLSYPSNQTLPFHHVVCPSGHLTHALLACDMESDCWGKAGLMSSSERNVPVETSCSAPLASLPPSFQCSSGGHRIAFSLVCDHRTDCFDSSDENFCVFPQCTGRFSMQCGLSKQCTTINVTCDGQRDCVNGEDEERCEPMYGSDLTIDSLEPPAIVNFNVRDFSADSMTIRKLPHRLRSCPETHFQCHDDGYCMPVFLRCNEFPDCPGHEDERGCSGYKCPGYYRCRGSKMCLHNSYVCDATFHCPQMDDEVFCEIRSPENCTCFGLACTCNTLFDVQSNLNLRYLDGTGSGVTQKDLVNNTMLVHLSLARCMIDTMDHFAFPNMLILDLRHNNIVELRILHIEPMPALINLVLSGNPLISFLNHDNRSYNGFFMKLKWLDLSNIKLPTINSSMFAFFPDLQVLNLTNSNVTHVKQDTFLHVKKLRTLDARGCPMIYFPGDLLIGLRNLRLMSSDNYKLCCTATLPEGFSPSKCHAPRNEISSCDNLLRSPTYRVVLSLMAMVALTGNLLTFIFRVFISVAHSKSDFSVFVINLSISDFLMGVYLALIGIADHQYQNTYIWKDIGWRHSPVCSLAGFLSFLSNEVSAMIISLITLERFIVLRFPFSSVRFGKYSSATACAAVWILCIVISAVPFANSWAFYSQTGLCIPLPVTRNEFSGNKYSFGVMVVLNFVLFLLIATGQALIFLSIRANSMAAYDTSRRNQDIRIARGLITIVMSDFLCWFPIGLLGLLASRGAPVPGEVSVAVAIIVLPLNSALNPFLYNFNLIQQRRQKARESRLLKLIIAQMEDDVLK